MSPDPPSARSRPEELPRSSALTRLYALEQFGIKLGLDNVRALTAALGHPENSFTSIHVAGTNGKGSVTAMVERALRQAGYRTGRYTSPHLDRIEERVAIDGVPVDTDRFASAAADVIEIIDRLRRQGTLETTPTFFEVTTAMAFELFRHARVDLAVIEVGLGGRFDATNVIAPTVCAITSIAFDHEKHLGHTLASIAFEKAGILKPRVPAVIGELQPEAARVIEQVASAVGAPLVHADPDCIRRSGLKLRLNGRHQVTNAAVAVGVLEALNAGGICVSAADIEAGLTDVNWPARLEWLRLRDGREILIDAAHNPSGAAALADYLQESGTAPLPIVLAVMEDKDVDGIVRALAPVASRFVATSAGTKRSRDAGDLAERIAAVVASTSTTFASRLPVESVADPEGAIERALSEAPKAAAAGSIFFVGPVRARLISAGAVSLQG